MATVTSSDGTEIFFEVAGDGPPVLLVHGITESSGSWGPISTLLAPRYQVITMDFRGHGRSATATTYDLASMASDVIAVADAASDRPAHLVGHSLGGIVVTAAAAAAPFASVVNVDQSLRMGDFKAAVDPARDLLLDASSFPIVVSQLFDALRGPLNDDEFARLTALRRPDQAVVLGVWDLVLNATVDEIEAAVDASLAGYREHPTPYLSLFGANPGEGYSEWLIDRIPGAIVELWDEHGHYPQLVDPERFIERVEQFWSASNPDG